MIRSRHLLLVLGVLATGAAWIGMHQLSLNHSLVTGPAALAAQQIVVGLTGGHIHPAVVTSPAAATGVVEPGHGSTQHAYPAADVVGDDCGAGCHEGVMTACLLVLSLVMVWLRRPPAERQVFDARRRGGWASIRLSGRDWRPALSLTELSVRRT